MSTRRKFIKCALCSATAACVPEPKFGDGVAQSGDTGAFLLDVDICNVDPDSSWSILSLDDYPELNAVGGFTYAEINGRNLIVAHVKSGCFVSLDRACTHEGETIQYQSEAQRFFCPRHAATFSATGDVIAGPAPTELEYFPTAQQGRELWIQV
ncbi:MAG: Rieske (2Fe-2S) protein [Myxococcota bacterium]|nr:Rieske (2Fe-2S) protein [Myxococcota bacterium]